MQLIADQLLEMLEHDEPTDIWLLNEDGSVSFVPDQDITEFQNPGTWPRYICRSLAVEQHVRDKGVQGALDHVNWAISLIPLPKPDLFQLTKQAAKTAYTAIRGK